MLTSTHELQQWLDGKLFPSEDVALAPGDYHVTGNETYRTLYLHSADPYAHRIFVHERPLKVGGNSRLRDLTFHAVDDIPLMLLDHSSRARIYDNFFNAPRAWDGKEPIETFERQGYGIVTTDDSISEDNWNVRITGNEFRWFRAGIDVRRPDISPIGNRLKGTAKWQIENNGFDGCAVGIRLVRPILFFIARNHIQLHETGIRVEHGHTNWLTGNDFERGYGKYDIAYDDDTCHMLATGNTAPIARLSPQVKRVGRNNSYARPLRKLNIGVDCSKGQTE